MGKVWERQVRTAEIWKACAEGRITFEAAARAVDELGRPRRGWQKGRPRRITAQPGSFRDQQARFDRHFTKEGLAVLRPTERRYLAALRALARSREKSSGAPVRLYRQELATGACLGVSTIARDSTRLVLAGLIERFETGASGPDQGPNIYRITAKGLAFFRDEPSTVDATNPVCSPPSSPPHEEPKSGRPAVSAGRNSNPSLAAPMARRAHQTERPHSSAHPSTRKATTLIARQKASVPTDRANRATPIPWKAPKTALESRPVGPNTQTGGTLPDKDSALQSGEKSVSELPPQKQLSLKNREEVEAYMTAAWRELEARFGIRPRRRIT